MCNKFQGNLPFLPVIVKFVLVFTLPCNSVHAYAHQNLTEWNSEANKATNNSYIKPWDKKTTTMTNKSLNQNKVKVRLWNGGRMGFGKPREARHKKAERKRGN